MWVVYDTKQKHRCGKAINDKKKAKYHCETANMRHGNDNRFKVIEVDF